MWRAAARRFLVLLGSVGVTAVVCSLLLGALLGASVNRSISLGLYLVGSFLLLGGFLFGNRGPLRRSGDGTPTLSFGRPLRRASPEEMRESVNVTVLLVTLGLLLLIVAIAVDNNAELI